MDGRIPDAEETEFLAGKFLGSFEGDVQLVLAHHVPAGLGFDGDDRAFVARLQPVPQPSVQAVASGLQSVNAIGWIQTRSPRRG